MSVVFLNQPKLSGNPALYDQDELRISLIPKIEGFLLSHVMFTGKDITVTFFENGASALVSLIETPQEKFVLKVVLRPGGPQGEPQFLKVWESVGVAVPHVYEYGMFAEHPYMLMSYIPAKSLEHYTQSELVAKEIFKRMGEILRQIHTTEAKGYGRMREEGVGEYSDFKSWLVGFPQTINQLAYMEEHNLLPIETFGSVEDAKEILIEYIGINTRTTYCHWDFAPGNILYTDPLTVFDPVPIYTHPYLDIARSIIQTIGAGYTDPEISRQFLQGYFPDENHLDKKVLQAAVLFISHTKMPHWHRINENEILENVKQYLVLNKSQ